MVGISLSILPQAQTKLFVLYIQAGIAPAHLYSRVSVTSTTDQKQTSLLVYVDICTHARTYNAGSSTSLLSMV